MRQLPEAFEQRMKVLLGDSYDAFKESFENVHVHSLRVNILKLDAEAFRQLIHFDLYPIPWLATGFYYEVDERPGKHPLHDAGLYYIQEASAMAVAEASGVSPGQKVLDLCAAPGGKSTQLAAMLNGEGLLIANEIHPARAKILSQNIERMGIVNAIVTNEKPDALSKRFVKFFDTIVVDAPCSGEGMFRKDPEALAQWTPDLVSMCAIRQSDILDEAVKMLKDGGKLVYSTCTFAPDENERQIANLLMRDPDLEIERLTALKGLSPGLNLAPPLPLSETKRIWPHLSKGEGHYLAVLRRRAGSNTPESIQTDDNVNKKLARQKNDNVSDAYWSAFEAFAHEVIDIMPKGKPTAFGEQLYLMPDAIEIKGLRVLRPGLHLGTVRKGRFEPSHALALALKAEAIKPSRRFMLAIESPEVVKYLKGETLPYTGKKGWYVVMAGQYPIGWGKCSDGILKNHYPKGLRRV
ncbi:MAG: hypothetical protein PWP51_1090 [Clostridiales bacterium]|nr:hypothetical protein [Clostridiales bacterium]